jgi:tetratricopeptide (TPR) repeat protein
MAYARRYLSYNREKGEEMIVTRKQACELIAESLNNDIELTGENLEAVILAVNSDIQVRDWLMGLPNRWTIEEGIKLMQYLCVHAPSEDLVPFVTLQALYYYELGNTEKSTMLLNYALRLDKNYSLAQLLLKVFTAGWPAEQFKTMRDNLDSKIIEACYGPEGATTIKENGELQYVNV